MTEVLGQLCDLLDGWVSEGELHLATTMSGHPQADTALRALLALEVFDVEVSAEETKCRVDPVVRQGWRRM
jgi:hypothetical protein